METSGLVLDRKLINARHGSWVNALNMQRNVSTDTIDVEQGFNYDNDCITTKYPEIGRLSANNEYVLLCTDGVNHQIVSSRKGVVIDDPLLGFNPLFPITGVTTYNHKGELIIAFTDNNATPKILNIDNLPFELNDDFSITDKSKFTLLELFPTVTEPLVELKSVSDAGSLKSGVYYITTAYAYSDESITSWLYKHNPISIIDDLELTTFDKIDGCKAGTITNKAINCLITNLDVNFKYIHVAVISKINGIISAVNYGKYPIDTFGTTISVVITSLDNATPLTLTDVLSNNAIYTKVKTLATLNNELLLGNVTGLPLFNFQQHVNDIKVSWVREKTISLDGFAGSYKDPTIIFTSKSFRAGEVYGLLLGLKLKQTGTYALYPIPGRVAKIGETDINTVTPILPNISKKYQIYDTSTVNSDGISGDMGYWENEHEVYPDWFPDNSDGLVFKGQNVRHHRFPTLATLDGYGQKFVSALTTAETAVNTLMSPINTVRYRNGKYVLYNNLSDTIDTGDFTDHNNRYRALLKQQVVLTITGNRSYITSFRPVRMCIRSYYPSGALKASHIGQSLYGSDDFVFNIYVELEAGEYLEYTIESSTSLSIVPNVHNQCTLAATPIGAALVGDVATKALGIKLENINIPEEILPYISGYELFYYERDNDNMTILDQSVVDPIDHLDFTTVGVTKKLRFHGFSVLSNQISPIGRYISKELTLTPISKTLYHSDTVGNYGKWNAVNDNISNLNASLNLVKKTTFVPANNNATEYDNLCKEDCFVLECVDDVDIYDSTFMLYNLCAYKTDMYNGFLTRRVVSIGQFIGVTDSGVQLPVKLYGGDTFISQYSYLIYKNSHSDDPLHEDFDKSFSRVIVTIPYECSSNIGFRHEGIEPHEKYYPKTDISLLEYDGVAIYKGPFYDIWQAGNSYLYNTDYNSVNNITSPFIWNNSSNFINTHLTRIHRSLPMNTESTEFKWRVLPAKNYYDMPHNKGEIVKLLAHGQALFIGMRNTTYKAFVKDLLSTLNSDAYLTRGDIFDREPTELIDSNEGVIGIQNQECLISTPFGVLALDRDQVKMYLINESLVPLNHADVYSYLKEHLIFNEEFFVHGILIADANTYIAEKEGSALLWTDPRTDKYMDEIDNIYNDKGVILGYETTDSTRFFVTARNKDFYPNMIRSEVSSLIGIPESNLGYYPDFITINITQIGDKQDCEIHLEFDTYTISLLGSEVNDTDPGFFLIREDIESQAIAVEEALNKELVRQAIDNLYTVVRNGTRIIMIAKQEVTNLTNRYAPTTYYATGIGYLLVNHCVFYYDKSFTLTYSFDNKYWVSRHSYKPTSYIQLRKGTFIVDGYKLISENKIYNTNGGHIGRYTLFTDSLETYLANTITIYPSYIDMAFNFKDGKDNYLLNAISWISKGYINNKLVPTVTFTKIMVYNETQCTGYITLVHVNGKQVGTLEYNNGVYYCNQFRDQVLTNNDRELFDSNSEPIVELLHDGEVTTLINGNTYMVYDADASNTITYNGRIMNYNGAKFTVVNNNTIYTVSGSAKIKNVKNWFDMSEINGKLAVVRLYTDNVQLTDLKLLDVSPLIKGII